MQILLQVNVPDAKIKHLCLDSRQVRFPSESVFFAIQGPMHDGHQFLDDAYRAGIRNFVVSKRILPNTPKANILLVADTVRALQKLASHHRHQFNLPVIGITGSNGKTIVKEWLGQCLSPDLQLVKSPRSYNSQVGVPLSLWQIQKGDQIGIFEAGISQLNEMEYLAPIIDCNIGLFTNIGDAHAAGFNSEKEKIFEKLKLFETTETLIYCKDHTSIDQAIHNIYPFKKTFKWSLKGKADLSLNAPVIKSGQCLLSAQILEQEWEITLPFTDPASVENAIHCWAILMVLKYPMPIIKKRIEQLEPVAMRMELKAGIHNSTLINDTYNADLASLRSGLLFLEQQEPKKERIVIISDILESGMEDKQLYQQVANLLEQHNIRRLYGIGNAIPKIQNFLNPNIEQSFFSSASDFLGHNQQFSFQNAVILIKGARRFELENIARRLAAKDHQTFLEVNLNALRHNLLTYKQQLKVTTKTLVMVKAAAYGSGAAKVARLMEYQQVDYLGVAYADEGVALRQASIQLPILVLNPGTDHFDTLIRYQLEPEIYSIRQLRQFISALPDLNNPFPIHLKLETGMNRLGFEARDLTQLIALLSEHDDQIKVASIFSHLAASETSEEDEFTHQQAKFFLELSQQICNTLSYQPLHHLLNSSGILRFPEYQFDMVRLGIGLYGFDSSKTIQSKLQAVLTFKAGISQIKELSVGQTIGYGRQGLCPAPHAYCNDQRRLCRRAAKTSWKR